MKKTQIIKKAQDDFGIFNHSLLLVGDTMTGKTKSISTLVGDKLKDCTLINSHISLYHISVAVPDEDIKTIIGKNSDFVNCTIWDCNGKIRNFNYFVLMNHISTAIIFCNLQNVSSCERIDYWKQIIDKYRPGILTIIVGTTLSKELPESDSALSTSHNSDEPTNTNTNTNRPKNKKVIERNTVNVLQWCVEHGDIPFFAVDLNSEDDVKEMYNSIFVDRLKKIMATL